MVTLLLLLTAVQQPQAVARVDRTTVAVGEEITLTLTVSVRGGGTPVEIDDPVMDGLELRNRRDRTRVTLEEGTPTRVTIRELTLRALRVGTATIGPIRIRHGGEEAETPPIEVRVTPPAAAAAEQLPDRVRRMLETAPPPELAAEEASVTLLLSTDSALVGEQVDVVVAVWFPRALRNRLRNPPTLGAPTVQGAWSYHRPMPSGVVVSRTVQDRAYDLFALHEVVFPLAPGSVVVGRASASYALPVVGPSLGREVRHEAVSDAVTLTAYAAPPVPPGTTGYRGAVGGGLGLEVALVDSEVPVGQATHLEATLTGRGNVALWPEPAIDWPLGIKVYPQQVSMEIRSENGRLGGVKVFEYLIVAESPGTHYLPPPGYVYYDVDSNRYRTVTQAGMTIVTPGGGRTVAPLQVVPPLLVASGPPLAERARGAIPAWGWALLLLLPPLAALAVRAGPRLPRRRRRSGAEDSGLPLRALETRFSGRLEELVPEAHELASDDLAAALRAAGVERSLAAHAARVRDRVRGARYGPGGAPDPQELAAEVLEILRALAGRRVARNEMAPTGVVALLVSGALAAGVPLGAQTPEQLYRADAVTAAADSFARRAAVEPDVAAHWYNLGNAWQRLGERAHARAAWIRAARLQPRDPLIRRALELAPTAELDVAPLTRTAPLTPAEAFVLAGAAWTAAWVLFALRRRARWVALLMVLAAALVGYGGAVQWRYARPLAVVIDAATPLREAPYGPAPDIRSLDEATAVLVERTWGPWRLVRAGTQRGWLLASEVEEL